MNKGFDAIVYYSIAVTGNKAYKPLSGRVLAMQWKCRLVGKSVHASPMENPRGFPNLLTLLMSRQ